MSTHSVPLAIEARGVRRVYKAKPNPIVALDGIDLQVEPGELFGLLGPNGAGKTTLIKILTTLLLPTSGTASVFGFDVARQTMEIRRIMNIVSGGEQSGYGLLQVREQLWMMSQFYGLGTREGWKRVDELIEAVGLIEQRQQKISQLSTGQRQKLNFARGLLNDPWIFFLDEPTLGLDVSAARAVRELVRDWRAAVPGRTILLTSHYMAEVEELCERLAIVDRGRILAIGSPAELKRRVQRESIFRLELDRLSGGPATLAALPGVVSAIVPSRADAGEGSDRQTVLVNLVLDRRRRARPGRLRAGWPRRTHRLAPEVGAEPRGRLRRAGRARLRGRELERRRSGSAGRGTLAGRTGRPTPRRRRTNDRHRAADRRAAGAGRALRAERTRGIRPMSTATDAPTIYVHRRTASPAAAAAWSPRHQLATNLRSILGRAYPRLIGLRREPSWLLFEILLPFLTTSAFVFVYRALQAPPEYVGFVVLGGAMTAFWLNVMWMTRCLRMSSR